MDQMISPTRRKISHWWLLLPLGMLVLLAVVITPRWMLRSRRSEIRQALASGQLTTALELAKATEKLNPRDAETQFLLARISRRLGDADQFIIHLNNARSCGYAEDRIELESRLMMAQSGQLQDTEMYCHLMLDENEDLPEETVEICRAYTAAYRQHFRPADALKLVDWWLQARPDDLEALFLRADVLREKKDYRGAVQAYHDALAKDPDNMDGHRGLARSLLELGELQQAEQEYRLVLAERSDDVLAMNCLGETLMQDDRMEEAREQFEKALKQDAANETARWNLARLAFQQSDYDASLRWLDPLLELWPQDAAFCQLKADVLKAQGREDEAAKYHQAASEAEVALEELDILRPQLNLRANNYEGRFEIGRLLLLHRSRKEGVQWLENALTMSPTHREANALLAEYYTKVGDSERAKTYHRRANPVPVH